MASAILKGSDMRNTRDVGEMLSIDLITLTHTPNANKPQRMYSIEPLHLNLNLTKSMTSEATLG